jgi:PKD repeat protein
MKKIALSIAVLTVLSVSLLITSCEEAPVPTAIFSTSIDGMDVTFTNSSKDADTYAWSFGDGGSSTDMNPVYTYAANGDYPVSLTAMGEGGEDMMTQTVTIDVSAFINTWMVDSSYQVATAYGTYTQGSAISSAAATAAYAIYIFAGITDLVATSCTLELVDDEDGTVLVNGAASTTTWTEESGVATLVTTTFPGALITGEINDLDHFVIECGDMGLFSQFPDELIPEEAKLHAANTNIDSWRFITSLVE